MKFKIMIFTILYIIPTIKAQRNVQLEIFWWNEDIHENTCSSQKLETAVKEKGICDSFYS